jgi:hypothetical protein
MSTRPRVPQVWIIWYAVLLHIGWGCLLLVSPSPYGATALHIYHDLPRIPMAGALFLASGLAAWAVTRRQPSLRSLSALLPQQVLLTLSAYAAIAAVIAGHYGDGLPRPRLFILADQAPAILALILHTAAVIEIHARTPDSEVLRITFEAIGAEQERFRQTLPERGSMPDERRPDRIFSRIEETDELLAEITPSSCSKRGGFSEASGPQVARAQVVQQRGDVLAWRPGAQVRGVLRPGPSSPPSARTGCRARIARR